MFNIILVGPPGSGKGTQAQRIIEKHHFIPIALGNLLRQQIVENGPNKPIIESYINSGQLVPDSLSLQLVRTIVQAQPPDAFLLFDGFPRTLDQATFLDNFLKECHTKIDGAIFLDVSIDHLLRRLKSRASIEQRADDQDENKIARRMQIYQNETLPIVSHYKAQGKLYPVNGAQDIDTVTEAIESIIHTIKL